MVRRTSNREPFVQIKGSAAVLVGVLVVLSAVLAACLEPPLPPGVQLVSEPAPSATPMATQTPLPVWPDAWTPTPTFTPWPTMTPTATPTFTPTPITYVAPRGSVTGPGCRPGKSKGPLTIDFEVNSAWCPGKGKGPEYRAEITVWASGGDGCYTYYRDIDLIGGPTRGKAEYELNWAACGGAPGTFFVESGDGQKAKVLFWIRPPSCCKGND